jgi:hypothetical protein
MRTRRHRPFFCTILFVVTTFCFAAVGSAQQNLSFFTCNPVQVATYKTYTVGNQTYPGKVAVQCNPTFSNYQLFAVPLGSTSSEAAEAARFLSLFTAAFVAGKAIEIGYIVNDTSGATFNCTANTLVTCYPAISATIK